MKKSILNSVVKYYKEPPITAVIILWGCILVLLLFFIKNKFLLDWNLLGDAMWWIFWTLISTITLIFVAYSFEAQHTALNIQKDELEATRKEFEKQNDVMRKDSFENTFFKLTEKQQNLIEYFQWWDKKWYDALHINENSFIYDPEFFGRSSSPPLAEYIKNYIRINEVIIDLIEENFKKDEDKKIYFKTIDSLQADIIRRMILGYYLYTKNDKYSVLIEKYIPNYSSLIKG